jgi:hypothetical protein
MLFGIFPIPEFTDIPYSLMQCYQGKLKFSEHAPQVWFFQTYKTSRDSPCFAVLLSAIKKKFVFA